VKCGWEVGQPILAAAGYPAGPARLTIRGAGYTAFPRPSLGPVIGAVFSGRFALPGHRFRTPRVITGDHSRCPGYASGYLYFTVLLYT